MLIMKLTLRLILFLGFVLAGIYAATPLWFPHLLTQQLPPGWQLERMETGYQGLSGIDIHSLQVKGGIQAADLIVVVTDLRFSYQGRKTIADIVSASASSVPPWG